MLDDFRRLRAASLGGLLQHLGRHIGPVQDWRFENFWSGVAEADGCLIKDQFSEWRKAASYAFWARATHGTSYGCRLELAARKERSVCCEFCWARVPGREEVLRTGPSLMLA